MSTTKLSALYLDPVDRNDVGEELQFRLQVQWIERHRLGLYKSVPNGLEDVHSDSWPSAWIQYLNDLGCPLDANAQRREQLEWLLSQAMHEFYQHCNRHPDVIATLADKQCTPAVPGAHALAGLDFHSSQFNAGVGQLASILAITSHPDLFVTLHAAAVVIQERLMTTNPDLMLDADRAGQRTQTSLSSLDVSFETDDPILDKVGRILRLLYVRQLRTLQTNINGAIVAIQSCTADPKTDDRLGKVGF